MPSESDPDGAHLAARLREYRKAAWLTQEDLAERSGLSVRMIRYIEGGRTQSPRGESLRLLAEALRLNEAEREQLLNGLQPRVPSGAGLHSGSITPPPPGGLIDRDDLICQIIEHLDAMPCLITLGGLPGVGKTAVANAAARELRDNGWEVFRASDDWSRSTESDDHLSVLVLDDMISRVDPLSCLSAIRTSRPALRILVTSRQPLRVDGEHYWVVPPLGVPAATAATAAEVIDVPAVRMFVSHLRQRWPGYRLTDADAAAVAALVRRLDGLPLALQLAAAHARVLTPADLLDRYGSNPLRLAEPLRAVLETVIGRLVTDDFRTLTALAVFADEWTLPMAATVVSDPDLVEFSLCRLCELGLINVTHTGTTMHFHVPESVRQILLARQPADELAHRPAARDRDRIVAADAHLAHASHTTGRSVPVVRRQR
ncbi:helix-turn-helix domain-containing protein [Actinoplanes sp. NPDC051633]|uniref:helix-turn-helix domain-containing protein n=1 Tax=Actinoplanes sp. NPDC051633 TaxID=3155670 RepID=UPI003420303B